jgi:hypothetical protein
VIQIRHDIGDPQTVVDHLRPYCVPELVRFEAIDVSIWPHNGKVLGEFIEMITKTLEAVETPVQAT